MGNSINIRGGGALTAVAAATLALGLVASTTAFAQTNPNAHALITQHVSDNDLVTVSRGVRGAVKNSADLGRISDDRAFPHIALQLQRGPEQQKALDKFLEDVNNPKSAEFHQWLTAEEFGSRFGVAAEDLAAVKSWVTSHGMTVNSVSANLVMDVSATTRQLNEAFHTEIHALNYKGAQHISNMTNPKFPAALRPVLAGPVGLNDFMPHHMAIPQPEQPDLTSSATTHSIVPLDLQTIYNMNPVYAAGISGQGQTIGILQDSDMFANSDFSAFRKILGLARAYPQGNLQVVHPNCADPGFNGNDAETAIDVEWSSAAAPNATILLTACQDQAGSSIASFGGFIAYQNLLQGPPGSFPMVFSVSFGDAETDLGTNDNLFTANLYALGAARGVSLFVSSGDEGAASYDADIPDSSAEFGIQVSGMTSTPYNVSVGGTDFADTYLVDIHQAAFATYWSTTNGLFFNSALSYIPEIPWNSSCASQLIATVNSSTPLAFCNSTAGRRSINIVAGSGGPSNCAFGNSTDDTAVAGHGCTGGYPKPSWQAGILGNPADGVRDIPDVSLFAANGAFGHFYLICYSDTTKGSGGKPCTNTPSSWPGFGGTSVSSPIMAGIQALINQRTGQAQGNPNPVYYAIANAEYGATGSAACNSSAAGGPSASCSFYDVTLGDIDLPCKTNTGPANPLADVGNPTLAKGLLLNCFVSSAGPEGVLSTSNTVLQPAYPTQTGWDFATGIGTVNTFNLVMNSAWPTAAAVQ
jgi:subtilase family serine protease